MAFYFTVPNPTPRDLGVLADDERGIKFALITKASMVTVEVFLLSWEGREIPVDCAAPFQVVKQGETYYPRRELRLGSTPYAEIRDYTFVDDQERRNAELIVIECLLAFGLFYDGLSLADGLVRVEANERQYRRSDFNF